MHVLCLVIISNILWKTELDGLTGPGVELVLKTLWYKNDRYDVPVSSIDQISNHVIQFEGDVKKNCTTPVSLIDRGEFPKASCTCGIVLCSYKRKVTKSTILSAEMYLNYCSSDLDSSIVNHKINNRQTCKILEAWGWNLGQFNLWCKSNKLKAMSCYLCLIFRTMLVFNSILNLRWNFSFESYELLLSN